MEWFGLRRNDANACSDEDDGDDKSDAGSLEPVCDLEIGADNIDNNDYDDDCFGEPSVPFVDPAVASYFTHSSATTTSTATGLSDGSKVISFRPLKARDRTRIQQLHTEWFPVTYSDEFYAELVNNHRLATSGDHLYTCAATLKQNERNLYCQEAGCASLSEVEEDEIIGCVVGSVLSRSRLSPETAHLILPNAEKHTRMFYIMTLGTVTEYRNYGVATSLVEKCMEHVEEDPSCGVLYLHVIPFNHAAIRFYEKLGFYQVCTIKDYYIIDGTRYDCYLYAKYFHGNHGHRTLYTLVSGAISSLWKQLKAPLSALADLTRRET